MRSGRWRAYWLGSNGHDTYDVRYHGLGYTALGGHGRGVFVAFGKWWV